MKITFQIAFRYFNKALNFSIKSKGFLLQGIKLGIDKYCFEVKLVLALKLTAKTILERLYSVKKLLRFFITYTVREKTRQFQDFFV